MTIHKECGREWTGLVECHCAGCHRQFSTAKNFDAHLEAVTKYGKHVETICVDPKKLKDKYGKRLLKEVQRATGPVWVMFSETADEHWSKVNTKARKVK